MVTRVRITHQPPLSAAIGATPYPFHGDGNSVMEKPRYEAERVWINADQYFDGVPAIAWEFHIGGYQPAQKWLKDRKGRALTYDYIRHYRRIIKILAEIDRIMGKSNCPWIDVHRRDGGRAQSLCRSSPGLPRFPNGNANTGFFDGRKPSGGRTTARSRQGRACQAPPTSHNITARLPSTDDDTLPLSGRALTRARARAASVDEC